jgi:hypothetical protein
MAEEIEIGASVECSDYPLGTVERVGDKDGDDTLFVRPARADYLLRIPRRLIADATSGRVKLNATLEDVEQYALQDDAQEPSGRGVETETADPGPRSDEVIPRQSGDPPTFPATG